MHTSISLCREMLTTNYNSHLKPKSINFRLWPGSRVCYSAWLWCRWCWWCLIVLYNGVLWVGSTPHIDKAFYNMQTLNLHVIHTDVRVFAHDSLTTLLLVNNLHTSSPSRHNLTYVTMVAKATTIVVVGAACAGVSQAFVAPMTTVAGTASVRQASSLSMAAADNAYHKKDFWIAPSILSADMAKLGEEVDNAMSAGADIVHFDVMDNHYVPNLTIGPLVCKGLRDHGVTKPIDVHLMVSPVDRIVGDFADAGASFITFHPEASPHVDRTLQLIKSHGCKAGA